MTIAVILCAIVAGASNTLPVSGTVIAPTDSCIQYIGRVCFDNPLRPTFNLPGTQIRARFEGTSLRLMARPQSGYFMAQIDNAEPFKISFNTDADSIVTIATALPEGIHSVKLMYITEGLFRNPEFRGLVLDKGCRLAPSAPLPERRIEFIGNSITCGYGNEATDGNEPYSDATENHYYNFASLTARQLDAIHVTVARSGAGVYRNFAGPSTGSADCLPTFYESTLYHKEECKWDFNRYRPHVVCVNLGTNDLSTDGFDEQLFKEAYRRFILTVRRHNPQAVIIMLSVRCCLPKGRNRFTKYSNK